METTTDYAPMFRALDAFIRQRPGLDPRNYISHGADTAGRAAYRAEVRAIGKDLAHARALLAHCEREPDAYGPRIMEAFRTAYSGRLSWDGERLDYTTGQYWPTEYRRAVCAVLADAIWSEYRDHLPPCDNPGDRLRASMRGRFGVGIARRWFR